MSTHAQVLRLRRPRRCLAVNGSDDVAFSLSGQDRHTKVVPVFEHKTGSSMAGLRYPGLTIFSKSIPVLLLRL